MDLDIFFETYSIYVLQFKFKSKKTPKNFV